MQPVYIYDEELFQKGYSLTVGQNMFMDLPLFPIQAHFDLPVATVDAAFHLHTEHYLYRFKERFVYNREQLTLGSVLYTIKANKVIRYGIKLNKNRDIIYSQEVVDDIYTTFSCRMLVRAIGIYRTQVDIENFLWDDDHEPTDDELSIAFDGHDLISGCLNRPINENRTSDEIFHNTLTERISISDHKFVPQTSAKNRGGRPRNSADDWAWHEVNVKGRTREEVYPEWLEKVRQVKIRILTDPKRSFRNAVSLARRRKPEGSDFFRVSSGDSGIE